MTDDSWGPGDREDPPGPPDAERRPAEGPAYPLPEETAMDIVETVVEYETPWYTGGYDLVEQPDGSRKRYYWAELPPAVVIVGLTDDRVVMVEQYRPAIRETHLELPAGIVEPGESFAEAGARELREETGYVAADASLLSSFWTATGVLRHRRGIVLADDLTETAPDLDDNEFLTVETVPVEDAVAVARSPPANDATIEGLLLAREDGYL